MMKKIFDYFDELFPNPKPELNYNNEFEFLIAIVLSAQTTDIKVNKATEKLFKKYNIDTLISADINDLINILRPIGMSKKKSEYIKSIAKDIKEKYDYKIPKKRDELITLRGVGRKTANVFLSQIANKPYLAVDTHVSRVSKRLDLVKKTDDVLTIENKLYKLIPKERILKTHLQMVFFGRYKCKSIKPICIDCKLKDICNHHKRTR